MAPISNLAGFAGLNSSMMTMYEASSALVSVVPVLPVMDCANMVEVPGLAQRPQETVVYTYANTYTVTQTQTRTVMEKEEPATTTVIYVPLPAASISAPQTTTTTTVTRTTTTTTTVVATATATNTQAKILLPLEPPHPFDVVAPTMCINMAIRDPAADKFNASDHYTGIPFFELAHVRDHFTPTLRGLTAHLARAYNTSVRCAWVAVSAALRAAERELAREIQESGRPAAPVATTPATTATEVVVDTRAASSVVVITVTGLLG